ncbi:MAG: helix-turn-helix domain-containing protein [Lachnospiraceae bacterium]|nr:helix-turn-helix domain-containing protein [Lachnospiraceae bacterium]
MTTTETKCKLYYTAEEVSNLLGISLGHSYKLIRKWNEELAENNYITMPGKIPKRFFEKHWYGYEA